MSVDLNLAGLASYSDTRTRMELRRLAGWTETEAQMAEVVEYKILQATNRVVSEGAQLASDIKHSIDRVKSGGRIFDSMSNKNLNDAAVTREAFIEVLSDMHGAVGHRLADELAAASPVLPEGHMLSSFLGGWECPDSPYGICYFDVVADPAKDGCLVCGEPEERK